MFYKFTKKTLLVSTIVMATAFGLQPRAATASANPFVGEIMFVGFNFAPRGWATCEGQLLPISQNQALFALLGTTFGGDGRTTFGLPDLRGRAPVGVGNGPGLTPRNWGQKFGTERDTFLPAHTHSVNASGAAATSPNPIGALPANLGRVRAYGSSSSGTMSTSMINPAGSPGWGDNTQPSLALYCVIALQGVFPSRN